MYPQVLTAQSQSQSLTQSLHGTKSTRIIATWRKNANAKLVTPLQGWYEIRSNISPGIKDRVPVHSQSSQTKIPKHVDLLPLQNRFEKLTKIPDTVPDFTSLDARETGASTVQTGVALTNGKTQVRKVPKKIS